MMVRRLTYDQLLRKHCNGYKKQPLEERSSDKATKPQGGGQEACDDQFGN